MARFSFAFRCAVSAEEKQLILYFDNWRCEIIDLTDMLMKFRLEVKRFVNFHFSKSTTSTLGERF